jgi:lysozyme
MTALDYALRLIKKWKGCRLTAYPDPATGGDPWTIGWGSTGKGIGPGVQWTLEQADDRLSRDVGQFMGSVERMLRVKPEPNELGAMTSLAYNIGLGNFRSSTLLRKYNAGDKKGAAAEFLRWNRAAGKVMRGLTNRRADERGVFLA